MHNGTKGLMTIQQRDMPSIVPLLSKPIRLAPKLTEKHLSASNFSAMSVKLATQVPS